MRTYNIIVETPKGSAQKYDFDSKTGYIALNKIMPVGMVFPFDFGFIEGTIGEDGDPLDIIVISEIKLFPGCAVECRIIGAIKASQKERDGEVMRNDRYIGIPVVSVAYAKISSIKDLPKVIIPEIESFFANYNAQAGKKFYPLERVNAKKALQMIEKGKNKQAIKNKLIQIFLPATSTKSKSYPQDLYDQLLQKLTTKFKGATSYQKSSVTGFWKNDEGKKEKDELIIFEVMSDEFDVDFWERYKEELKKAFKQKDIVIRCFDMNLI